MDIVFMGTPEFAIPCLNMLIRNHNVLAVATQPDKPKGRGKTLAFSPVKEIALSNNIPVYQPVNARDDDFIETLKNLNPDIIVVVAYGQILPEVVLNIPCFGAINVHGSLLPKLRGAAPIQWAIINGEEKTGLTTMYMAKGLDSGDMILKEEINITLCDTYGSLHDKMSVEGAKLLFKTLCLVENKIAPRISQDHSLSTYAPMITRETEEIKWDKPAFEIVNLIRGLNPSPGAFTKCGDDTLKVWKAVISDFSGENFRHGEISSIDKNCFTVKTGDGFVDILEIQAKGGKKMDTASYLRGHKIKEGVILG